MVIENLTSLAGSAPGIIEGASFLAKAIWALGGAIIFYVIFYGILNHILNILNKLLPNSYLICLKYLNFYVKT